MPRTRPAYSQEFKDQAVDLLLSSERPLKELSRELGISDASLRKWRDERAVETVEKTKSRAKVAESPEAEIKRLRRENEYLKRQREILKKAMSILGEDPHLGMR
jgi:transposase